MALQVAKSFLLWMYMQKQEESKMMVKTWLEMKVTSDHKPENGYMIHCMSDMIHDSSILDCKST